MINICVSLLLPFPRFCKLEFLSSDDILKVQVELQTLALQAKRSEKELLQQASEEQEDTASPQPQVSKRRSMSMLDTLSGLDSEEHSDEEDTGQEEDDAGNEVVKNEVLMYFGEQCIAKDTSPLQWKETAARFPTLAILAKSYMSIPSELGTL